jgi:hypothetical protein
MTIASGQISVTYQATPSKTIATGVQTGTAQARINKSWAISSGTVLDKADQMYSYYQSITGSSSVTLDLTSLADAFGDVVNFARVKAIIVVNKSTANSITVGNATNPFEGWISAAGTITIPASTATNESWFAFSTPNATAFAVTAGSADELEITNDGATASIVEVMIIGATA